MSVTKMVPEGDCECKYVFICIYVGCMYIFFSVKLMGLTMGSPQSSP